MQSAFEKNTDPGKLLRRLNRLIEVGVALSSHKDPDELLELILKSAKDLTHADGGTLYSVTKGGDLKFEIVLTDSLGIQLGGISGDPIVFPHIPLTLKDGSPNHANVAAFVANSMETVNFPDAYQAKGFEFSGMKNFDAEMGYRTQSMLTVPMQNHEGDLTGVIQLINCKNPENGQIVPFSFGDQHLVESFASQAAVSIASQQLIHQLNEMLEGFIWAIAEALDEKSPYTGGHCRRVPIITEKLAKALNRTKEGPFANFEFSKEDLYELRMAALLHDCGKITTPVHVVDKSTRLETLWDRIELISTRFDSLKRQEEVRFLKKQLEIDSQEERKVLQEELEKKLEQYESDQEFVEECNSPSVFMDEEKRERIRSIGEYRWVDPEGRERTFLSKDELKNLMIERGTLNEDERHTIEQHVVSSIKMLRSLTYPKHLQRVPEIAGAHHEAMDGTGYPRKLTGEQMSVQARILAMADIFESLTAADRPYKKPIPLSKSLEILEKEVERGKLDPTVFDVFLREKVYLEYAREYLPPEQVDLQESS